MLNETSQILAAIFLSLAVPLILIATRLWRERKSVAVLVKVIKIDEVHNEDSVYFYPTFEVIDGPYIGATYLSEWDFKPKDGHHILDGERNSKPKEARSGWRMVWPSGFRWRWVFHHPRLAI